MDNPLISLMSEEGIEITLRMVEKGDRFGVNSAILYDKDVPSVEFFYGGAYINRFTVFELEGIKDSALRLTLDGDAITLSKENIKQVNDWIKTVYI